MIIILYIIQSIIIIFPFVFGLFLVFNSRQKLTMIYQDLMLRYTRKPLKDEDFQDVYRKVLIAKIMGTIMLIFSLLMAVLFIMAKTSLSFY